MGQLQLESGVKYCNMYHECMSRYANHLAFWGLQCQYWCSFVCGNTQSFNIARGIKVRYDIKKRGWGSDLNVKLDVKRTRIKIVSSFNANFPNQELSIELMAGIKPKAGHYKLHFGFVAVVLGDGVGFQHLFGQIAYMLTNTHEVKPCLIN